MPSTIESFGSDAPKEKIRLQAVEETLLAVVYFRANDAKLPNPVLGDPYAQPVLDRCEVDMSKSYFDPDPRWARYVAHRAKRFDSWCQEFIDAHAGGETRGDSGEGNEENGEEGGRDGSKEPQPVTVLHLACGLDARNLRVNRDPQNVRWIDLDRPMVVDLRHRLFPRPHGDYTLRNLSVTDEGWLNDIPADRPTIIIAEGLFPYLDPQEAEKVISEIVSYFDHGVLAFDTLGSLVVRFKVPGLKSANTRFKWGVDDARDVLKIHPKLALRDQVRSCEYMGRAPFGQSSPPWFGAWGTALAWLSPNFKDNGQLLRFEF